MSNILSIGAGVMGTAITIPATNNGHNALIVGTNLDKEIINSIKEKSYHPILDVQLINTIAKHNNEMTQEDIDKADVVVVGVNSQGLDWFIDYVKKFNIEKKKFLLITKGMYVNDNNKLDIFPNKILKNIDQDINITAVTGPCKAQELANKNLTNICFVNEELDIAIQISNIFKNNFYIINTLSDLIGSEASAALKNIYAIIIGYSQIYYSNNKKIFNPESALFSHCLNEMNSLVVSMGGRTDTVYGLSGLGDLHVTSGTGRNGSLGKFLAKNKKYSEIISHELKGETIEGALLIQDLQIFFQQHIDLKKLPILNNILLSICKDQKLDVPWSDLNI